MEHRITGFYYYIGKNNIQCGPVLRSQLVALGVTPDTFVWKEGMADWQQAKNVEELNQIWNHSCYDYPCNICRLDDSAICKDCKDGSLFSLCESISPNWLLRQPRHISSSCEQEYIPTSATGWLIAAYIFAFLGGLLGIAFGISIWNQKVELNGKKVHKYKKSHRQLGLLAAIIATISVFVWKFAAM